MRRAQGLAFWLAWVLLLPPGAGAQSNSASSALRYVAEASPIPGLDKQFTVEIGDSTSSTYSPSFLLGVWGGEGSFRVRLANSDFPLNDVTPNERRAHGYDSVIVASGQIGHHLFAPDSSHFEWSFVLPTKPRISQFVFDIVSTGLGFHYQGELTADELASGDTRPDSVVGSYAVYHQSARHVYRQMDGKNSTVTGYGTGKAFHIFRPQAWDATGDTIWCDLHIDTVSHTLTITRPEHWLQAATYPVTVDPIFGKTDIGASQSSLAEGLCVAHLDSTYTASSGNAVTALYWYGRTYYTDSDVGGAIYSVTSSVPDSRLQAEVSVTGLFSSSTAQWYSTTVNQTLSSGTEYTMAIRSRVTTNSPRGYYDNLAGTVEWMTGQSTLPATWSGTTYNRYYSFYAEVTSGGGSSNLVGRRRRTILEAHK